MTLVYIFFTALLVFVNEPDAFASFYDAVLWSTTTLTSVGFESGLPHSLLGRIVSHISTIVAIGVVALPSGIIAGAYIDEMHSAEKSDDY